MHDLQTKYLYFLSALIFLTALCLVGWFGYNYFADSIKKLNITTTGINEIAENCNYQRVLDGVCVKTLAEVNPGVVGVMIENHTEARPQAGLNEARVVYEIPAEGNITRFLALYLTNQKVVKIGPVRSARAYYLDYLGEYGTPLYMHVGGSPEALELIKARGINDLNEFYNGVYYRRAENRSAPHNVYTSSELWNKVIVSQETDNVVQDNWTGWKFNTSTSQIENNLVSKIKIDFNLKNYNVEWQFNSSTKKLERYVGGNPQLDEQNRIVLADNVAVIATSMRVIDEIGRLQIKTLGSGKAIVYKSGQIITGTWQKDSLNSRTRFYDDHNQEIIFNPGKVWVEIVGDIGKVSW